MSFPGLAGGGPGSGKNDLNPGLGMQIRKIDLGSLLYIIPTVNLRPKPIQNKANLDICKKRTGRTDRKDGLDGREAQLA